MVDSRGRRGDRSFITGMRTRNINPRVKCFHGLILSDRGPSAARCDWPWPGKRGDLAVWRFRRIVAPRPVNGSRQRIINPCKPMKPHSLPRQQCALKLFLRSNDLAVALTVFKEGELTVCIRSPKPEMGVMRLPSLPCLHYNAAGQRP